MNELRVQHKKPGGRDAAGLLSSYIDLVWAAGLFEGRGSLSVRHIRHRPRRKPAWEGRYAMLELKSYERERIVRFAETVGRGVVAGPLRPSSRSAAPLWRWRAHGSDALAVIELLHPWLGRAVLTQAARLREIVQPVEPVAVDEGHPDEALLAACRSGEERAKEAESERLAQPAALEDGFGEAGGSDGRAG